MGVQVVASENACGGGCRRVRVRMHVCEGVVQEGCTCRWGCDNRRAAQLGRASARQAAGVSRGAAWGSGCDRKSGRKIGAA